MNKKRLRELAGIITENLDDDEFAEDDAMAEKRQAAIQPHMDAVSRGIEEAIITLTHMGVSEEDAKDSVLEDVRYMCQSFQ